MILILTIIAISMRQNLGVHLLDKLVLVMEHNLMVELLMQVSYLQVLDTSLTINIRWRIC